MRRASNAEFCKDRAIAGRLLKLDATLVQVDELTRSVDRREPLDLPPLPLVRRVN